jgi:hypothetical protein
MSLDKWWQMLVGVVAFNTLKVIAPEDPRALGILLTGYIFQGQYYCPLFYCKWIKRPSQGLDSSWPFSTFASTFCGKPVAVIHLERWFWCNVLSIMTVRRHFFSFTKGCWIFQKTGFLDGHQANGAFVACGPPGFTALALINLAAFSRDM